MEHEEGKSQGLIARVPYHDLKPTADG